MLTKNYLAIYAKSFNWAGFFLPKKTYQKCSALYDFCREADNIADNENKIEVWGDGKQTRSFLYIDDCVEGTLRLFESDYFEPVNIGSDEQVSINQMIEIIEDISGIKKLERVYQLDKPKGVRGRSSNNDLVKKVLMPKDLRAEY